MPVQQRSFPSAQSSRGRINAPLQYPRSKSMRLRTGPYFSRATPVLSWCVGYLNEHGLSFADSNHLHVERLRSTGYLVGDRDTHRNIDAPVSPALRMATAAGWLFSCWNRSAVFRNCSTHKLPQQADRWTQTWLENKGDSPSHAELLHCLILVLAREL